MRIGLRKASLILWLAAVAAVLVVMWGAKDRLGMEEAPLSPRYTLYAIPAAISVLRGKPHDYTAYMEVAAPFLHHTGNSVEQNIRNAWVAPVSRRDDLWLVSGDDKGLIDLTLLAFAGFGVEASALFTATFLIFSLSVLLFVLQFHAGAAKMALLLATLAGLYAVFFTFQVSDQSTSFIEPRFLGFLSVVSTLHILLLLLAREPLSRLSLVLAAGQVALMLFAVHVRTSALWQVLCVAAVYVALLPLSGGRRQRSALILLLAVGFLGLQGYKRVTFNRAYFDGDISTRVVWHNALSGLGANPFFHRAYHLDPLSDVPTTQAVDRYLSQTGQTSVQQALFANPNYAGGNFQGFKWAFYEPAARDLYLSIAAQYPIEVARTYAVFVPQRFLESVIYLWTGRSPHPERLLLTGAASASEREARGLYLDPFRPMVLVLLGVAAVVLAVSRDRIMDRAAIVASLTAAAFAAIPPALAMPAVHYAQLCLAMLLAAVYLLLVLVAAAAVRRALAVVRRPQDRKLRTVGAYFSPGATTGGSGNGSPAK